MPPNTAIWAKTLLFVGWFAMEDLWYGIIVILLSSPPARETYKKFGKWIERFISSTLIAFGFRIILEKP